MKSENKAIVQLKKLKIKLNNGQMSVLVGAGFSKNVNNKLFPSWWELLFEMTLFIYKQEINSDYLKEVPKRKQTNKAKEKFISEKVSYYIDRIGFLNIVSQYISRKGIREAITLYIENHTPRIKKIRNKNYLVRSFEGSEQKNELQREHLSQHYLLLQLPWNNVYTTNYDELLEHSVDSSLSESVKSEIKAIESEIEKYLKEKQEVEVNSENLKSEIELINSNIKKLAASKESQEKLNSLNKKKDELIKRELNLSYQLKDIVHKISNNEELRSLLSKVENELFSLVTKSEDLSLKRNKNIVKLHGTLRSDKSQYGFDGDIHKQYVIASEDYETYPSKHEAFTQLMRISLLQESYCLVGFSGDDPNFLEWIKWVRGIIQRGKIENDNYKIYLITINNDKIDDDKRLFLENHRVFPIPIMDQNVIDFLQEETQIKPPPSTPKDAINLFLKYLKGGVRLIKAKAIYEKIQLEKYNKHWRLLNISSPNNYSLDKVVELSKKIHELKKYDPFPSLEFTNSDRKYRLLFHAIRLINDLNSKKKKDALISLIIQAIKDVYLIPDQFIWDKDQLVTVEESINSSTRENQYEYYKLQLRESVLYNDHNKLVKLFKRVEKKRNEIIYEKILSLAYTLKFDLLKRELKEWDPDFKWIIRKAGLLALFDTNEALIILTDQKENFDLQSQEELNLLEMINRLQRSISFSTEKELLTKINDYKNQGLSSITKNIDFLIGESSKSTDRIQRYGDGRFSVSHNFSFSNDFTIQQKGLQFIQNLAETGLQLKIGRTIWFNSYECYPLLKNVFEYFPYPVLFYGIQLSEEKVIRRLGQDYAYSKHLSIKLDDIISKLLDAYLNEETPPFLKGSILNFSSELIISVNPSSWQNNFKTLWNNESFASMALRDIPSPEETFINSCLPFINDESILRSFINEILKKPDSSNSVTYLFYLAKNKNLEENSQLQTTEIREKINNIINTIHTDETRVFVIGNLYSILDLNQRELVKDSLKKIEFNKIENERIWSVLLFFADGDYSIQKEIKKGIISNTKLFNAGFTDRGISMGINYIEVSKLTNSENPQSIEWTKSEAKQIFKKISSELKKIKELLAKRDHDFKFILHEMILFVEKEKDKVFNKMSDFKSFHDEIILIYNKNRGYDKIIDGLLSKEKSKVVWALSEISIAINIEESIDNHQFEVSTIMEKVLLQSEPSIEACLNYIASWVNDYNLNNSFRIFKDSLLKILETYSKDESLAGFNKPFVYEQLVMIAIRLKQWGESSKIVTEWLTYKEETIFNNIKAIQL